MSVSASQLSQHYRTRSAQAAELIAIYTQLQDRLYTSRDQLEQRAAGARLELARAYLPELSAPAIQRAERLTGFRGFSRRDPLAAMARELAVLQKTIVRIEADERYRKRKSLVGPHGSITRKLEEARSMLEPWEHECARFESLEGFLELVEVGYDTPEYESQWWRGSYWKRWAAGDRICEALGLDDFGDDVLPAYRKVVEPRDRWRGQIAEIEVAVEAIHRMVQERDQAEARAPRLPELYLARSQELLAEFLAGADLALLDEWLKAEGGEPDRAVQMGLRKAAGMAAKIDFLSELAGEGIEPLKDQLAERQRKYDRKISKYSRSKYAYTQFDEVHMDRKFEAKYQKLKGRRDALERVVDKMLRYESYERFDLSNDPELWWREFTGGRPPRQLPKLRGWYDRHPDARPLRAHTGDGEAAAEAAAAFQVADDLGYLS